MSDDLREKLRGILMQNSKFNNGNLMNSQLFDYYHAIEQIEQAYSDAGYTTVQEVAAEVVRVHKYARLPKPEIGGGYITGQEWYNRFINYFTGGTNIIEVETHGKKPDKWSVEWNKVDLAARRAAGLDEQSK